jgi:WD40 repeat protein
LAAAGNEDVLWLWELASGKEWQLRCKGDLPDRLNSIGVRVPRPPAGAFTALVFCQGGRTLVGGRMDGHLYLWHLSADRPADKVQAHRECVSGLAVAPDGKTVASASGDSTVLVWDVSGLKASDQ